MIDLGDTFTSSIEVYTAPPEEGGTLTNASTVVLTITLPDQTILTPSPVNTSTGKYKYDLVTAQAGRHVFRWVTTGPNTAWVDEANISPADPGYIISLADAKTYLTQGNPSWTADDEELRSLLEELTDVVENDPDIGVGPVVVRPYTDYAVEVSGGYFFLTWKPVVSLTSITASTTYGAAINVADLKLLDPKGGRVGRIDGTAIRGYGSWDIGYKAGRSVIPPAIRGGAKDILLHWWRTQRGASGAVTGRGTASEEVVVLGSGHAVPYYAAEKLRSYKRAPAVA